jgi:hypothetical protein
VLIPQTRVFLLRLLYELDEFRGLLLERLYSTVEGMHDRACKDGIRGAQAAGCSTSSETVVTDQESFAFRAPLDPLNAIRLPYSE